MKFKNLPLLLGAALLSLTAAAQFEPGVPQLRDRLLPQEAEAAGFTLSSPQATTFLSAEMTAATPSSYDANISGEVVHISVYTYSDRIYFRLDNQPNSHPRCNTYFFSIDRDVDPDNRRMLMARLMTAYTLKEPIMVGYDSQGGCSNGYLRVHRIG